MNGLLPFLLGFVLLAILGVLVAGVVSVAKGGEFNRKYSNRLMRWRVLLQAVAIGLLLLLMLAR